MTFLWPQAIGIFLLLKTVETIFHMRFFDDDKVPAYNTYCDVTNCVLITLSIPSFLEETLVEMALERTHCVP